VSRDFLLQVFHESSAPKLLKPVSATLAVNFPTVVDTNGKFATGVNNTSD
jgi:hypothetical protein